MKRPIKCDTACPRSTRYREPLHIPGTQRKFVSEFSGKTKRAGFPASSREAAASGGRRRRRRCPGQDSGIRTYGTPGRAGEEPEPGAAAPGGESPEPRGAGAAGWRGGRAHAPRAGEAAGARTQAAFPPAPASKARRPPREGRPRRAHPRPAPPP
ncbi:serine/arginine repetitive matrix protein 3-like [Lutra lutra]|uniref:serine/arginine repetitive matrix protein 3-like n=1 Tax=Lutra lutra TaxID=9657 RepID=UPI001FCFFDF0|nr:serine/arginine repetitive matrix protein 3-like [Lutra lutra]